MQQAPRSGDLAASELSRERILTQLVAVTVLSASLLLGGAHVVFLTGHPAATPALTIPFVLLFVVLGALAWQRQVVLFVFLTPLINWLAIDVVGAQLNLLRLLLPVVFASWSVRLLSARSPSLPAIPLRRPLLVYCALLLVSSLVALSRYHPVFSADSASIVFRELVDANHVTWWAFVRPEFCIATETVVYTALPLFLLLLLQSADSGLRRSVRVALIAAATFSSVVAVGERVTGAASAVLSIDGRPNMQRVSGTLSDPNTLGAFLAMISAIIGVEILLRWKNAPAGGSRRHQDVAALSALVVVGALVLVALLWTSSRAAWLGLAAAGCHLAWSIRGPSALEGFRRSLLPWFATVLVLVLLVVAGSLYSRPYHEWNSVADVFLSLFSHERLRSEVWVRWCWWSAALRMAAAFPLTGVGAGFYRHFVDQYWPLATKAGILSEPHNYYLKVLSELGLPGLIVFLWIAWTVWRSGSSREAPDSTDAWRTAGARAALVALGLNMIFQHTAILLEMQIVTAAVAWLALPATGADSPRRRGPRTGFRASTWIGAAVLAAIVWSRVGFSGAPRLIPPGEARRSGEVTLIGDGVRLGRSGRLDVDVVLELGRMLILVPAWSEGCSEATNMMVLRNGQRVADWPLSTTRTVFVANAFSRRGSNEIQLRAVRSDSSGIRGTCRVYLDPIVIAEGHEASRLLRLDDLETSYATLRSELEATQHPH